MICRKARKPTMTIPVARMTVARVRICAPRAGPDRVPVLGDLHDAAGDEVDQQDQCPGVKGDKEQLGQADVEKFLYVGKPLLVEAAKKRRRRIRPAEKRGKEEKGGVH